MNNRQRAGEAQSHHASLIDRRSGGALLPSLRIASTFFGRLRGLQFRKPLSSEEGLLIVPCRSIHTHWMRFSIDVAWIDSAGCILDVKKCVPPWKIVQGPTNALAVIETTAQVINLETGQYVAIAMPHTEGGVKSNRSLIKLSEMLVPEYPISKTKPKA